MLWIMELYYISIIFQISIKFTNLDFSEIAIWAYHHIKIDQ